MLLRNSSVDKAVPSQEITATLLKKGEGLMDAHSAKWNDANPVNNKKSPRKGDRSKRRRR